MIKAASLITQVARYLTDYDSTDPAYQHVEWSKQDLLDYFRQAVYMVAAADPKANHCRVEMDVGGEQIVDLPDKCDTLLQVLGFIDASGKLFTNVKYLLDDKTPFVSSRPVCTATRNLAPDFEVRMSADSGHIVTFNPAPPTGRLVLSCSCSPSIDGDTAEVDMLQKYEPILFWWMVSMAFGTDIEAAPMRERSDQYWERGAMLLRAMSPKATIPQRKA